MGEQAEQAERRTGGQGAVPWAKISCDFKMLNGNNF